MTKKQPQTEQSNLSFEELIRETEDLAEKLESCELSLEQALMVYEKGIENVRLCASKLAAAEQKVQMLIEKSGELDLTEMEKYPE